MKTNQSCYHGYRYPPDIISHAVWLYHRFALSFRDPEELLAERGVVVTYETIRQWCQKFGPHYARKLRCKQGRLGDIWHLDELFVNIQGKRHYLWVVTDKLRSFQPPFVGLRPRWGPKDLPHRLLLRIEFFGGFLRHLREKGLWGCRTG